MDTKRTYLQAAVSGTDVGPVYRWDRWYASSRHADMLGPPSWTDKQVLASKERDMLAENEINLLIFKSQSLQLGDPESAHNLEHSAFERFITGCANQEFSHEQTLRISKLCTSLRKR